MAIRCADAARGKHAHAHATRARARHARTRTPRAHMRARAPSAKRTRASECEQTEYTCAPPLVILLGYPLFWALVAAMWIAFAVLYYRHRVYF